MHALCQVVVTMIFDSTYRTKLDLSPAKWIWYPSVRTLSNTFVLFRKEFELNAEVLSADGYVAADSRYCLYVNGERVQWGPAPSDPRYMEADPMSLAAYLKTGKNVLAFRVLYYGFGEGTWVAGTPGLLFRLRIKLKNGETICVDSDTACRCAIDWSHRPGEFQRWYLRSLQEICDGRKQIDGWNEAEYLPDDHWSYAMEIGDGDQPSVCTKYADYANDGYDVTAQDAALFKRDIPMLHEYLYDDLSLVESGKIHWYKDKDYWFLFREPNTYSAVSGLKYTEHDTQISFEMEKNTNTGSFLTYELKEQVVGFPFFVLEAPEGTSVELITQEGHTPGSNFLLDSGHYCWSRYICHAGENCFEAFDFESLKWLQLHLFHPSGGNVIIKKVGVRRRIHPFQPCVFHAENATIQRIFEAGINTIYNAAQETIVDGMGRERQQYSGDVSHIHIAMRYALGDKLLCERFIQTYMTGMTDEGLFMDSWPGVDRVKRLTHRQIGLTFWGNIVDHSIQFVFDCYKYYLSSGNLECLRAPMKAFEKLVHSLMETCGDGLFPTDNRNNGFVWLDHDAYSWTDHKIKECAINLYLAGMLENAYIPLCRAFVYDEQYIADIAAFAKNIVGLVTDKYWCEVDRVFYDNLPYVSNRKDLVVADRTLAMAVIYGYCKQGDTKKSVQMLRGENPAMKRSYPANAVWRMWALAKVGDLEPFVEELFSVWGNMPSVWKNNTYQEYWTAFPDSTSEWSHIPSAPLVCLYEGILGLKCNNVNGNRLSFTPQLKGFCGFETVVYNNGITVKVQVKKISNFEFVLSVEGNGCDITVEQKHDCTVTQMSDKDYLILYLKTKD